MLQYVLLHQHYLPMRLSFTTPLNIFHAHSTRDGKEAPTPRKEKVRCKAPCSVIADFFKKALGSQRQQIVDGYQRGYQKGLEASATESYRRGYRVALWKARQTNSNKQALDDAYNRGFRAGKDRYCVITWCSACKKPMEIDTPEVRKAAGEPYIGILAGGMAIVYPD